MGIYRLYKLLYGHYRKSSAEAIGNQLAAVKQIKNKLWAVNK